MAKIRKLLTGILRLHHWPAGRMWRTMFFVVNPEGFPLQNLWPSVQLTWRRESSKKKKFDFLFGHYWFVVLNEFFWLKFLVEMLNYWCGDPLVFRRWNFTAGSSRNRYVCSRTLVTPWHPCQTSGHKVIADTTTTSADNEITVGGCQFEQSESRALGARHFLLWIRIN